MNKNNLCTVVFVLHKIFLTYSELLSESLLTPVFPISSPGYSPFSILFQVVFSEGFLDMFSNWKRGSEMILLFIKETATNDLPTFPDSASLCT